LALAVTSAGAGALVEKPLCRTLSEADRLVAAAVDGAQIAYAENLVHAPAVRRALAHTAQIRPLDVLEVQALQSRPTWGDFLTEDWGGGVLFDLGVHPLAVALLMAAPAYPVEVRAELEGADDHPVDEHAELRLRFDSGLDARVISSWRGDEAAPIWDALASSPHGVVRLELLPEIRLERDGTEAALPDGRDGVPRQLEELGYLAQLESFADDLRDGRPPELGAAFGRSVLDVVCAAYWSAGQDGAWVPRPFEGPRDRSPLELWHPR
jgi:predicted dehydrogenase